MQASIRAQSLNRQALTSFQSLFASLAPPSRATGLVGVYRAEFVRPAWLRQIAPPRMIADSQDRPNKITAVLRQSLETSPRRWRRFPRYGGQPGLEASLPAP